MYVDLLTCKHTCPVLGSVGDYKPHKSQGITWLVSEQRHTLSLETLGLERARGGRRRCCPADSEVRILTAK